MRRKTSRHHLHAVPGEISPVEREQLVKLAHDVPETDKTDINAFDNRANAAALAYPNKADDISAAQRVVDWLEMPQGLAVGHKMLDIIVGVLPPETPGDI